MSAKAWCAFVHVIKEYWSNWMRCAKISVIINMITSNYILRYFLYWKSISLCGHTTISACVVCKSTTMELFISAEKERLTRFFCCCYSNCTWSWFPVLQISRRKNMMWNEREMIFKIHKLLTNCYIINWDMFTVWNLHNNHFATSLFYQCNTNHSTLLSKKTTKQDLFSCNHIKLIPEANLSHFTCLFVAIIVIHLSAFWCEEMQIFFLHFFRFSYLIPHFVDFSNNINL